MEKLQIFKIAEKFEVAQTDNAVFRLHYKLSVIIVMAAISMYALMTFNGEMISCIFPHKASSIGTKKEQAAYCWIAGIYTVSPDNKEHKGMLVMNSPLTEISPGVSQIWDKKQSVRYHTYYFWTPFILLAQLFLFYSPRFIWYSFEAGKIKMLTEELRGICLDHDIRTKRKKLVGEYFVANLHYNNLYAFYFVMCEILNFVGVIVQMFFLDWITDHVFFSLGADFNGFGRLADESLVNPMVKGFPLLGKCTMSVYGPGGNIIPFDGICSLPLNMASQRYFVFMWFYLMVLSGIDSFNIIFRLITIFFKPCRYNLLHKKAYICPDKLLREILKDCYYGDWFLLNQIATIIDGRAFREILEEIRERLRESKSNV